MNRPPRRIARFDAHRAAAAQRGDDRLLLRRPAAPRLIRRATPSRNGWSPMCSITLAPGRGIRRRRAWNSPQRRWSVENVKPAIACTLPFAATRAERASASHVPPRFDRRPGAARVQNAAARACGKLATMMRSAKPRIIAGR